MTERSATRKWWIYGNRIQELWDKEVNVFFRNPFLQKLHQLLPWSSWRLSSTVSALSNVTPFPPLLRVPGGLVKNDKKENTGRGKSEWTWLPTLNISLLSSYTFERVQEDSDKVWKFQRYELIAEYHGRPLFFPPLIFISHILLFVRWIWQLCRCGNPPSGSSMSKFFLSFWETTHLPPPLTQSHLGQNVVLGER